MRTGPPPCRETFAERRQEFHCSRESVLHMWGEGAIGGAVWQDGGPNYTVGTSSSPVLSKVAVAADGVLQLGCVRSPRGGPPGV